MDMEQSSGSFCRALALICTGVEMRLVGEKYGVAAPRNYAGLADDAFSQGYAIMDEALALT